MFLLRFMSEVAVSEINAFKYLRRCEVLSMGKQYQKYESAMEIRARKRRYDGTVEQNWQ